MKGEAVDFQQVGSPLVFPVRAVDGFGYAAPHV